MKFVICNTSCSCFKGFLYDLELVFNVYKKGTGQVPDDSLSPLQRTSKTQLTNAVPTDNIS